MPVKWYVKTMSAVTMTAREPAGNMIKTKAIIHAVVNVINAMIPAKMITSARTATAEIAAANAMTAMMITAVLYG
jgi:hypothetical protein